MREYGLLLETVSEHGTEYIKLTVAVREPGKDHPVRCASDGEDEDDPNVPKHMRGLVLEGLGLYGFVTENKATFIAGEPEYRDIFVADLRKSERMVRTLKRVKARIRKDCAYEPGDQLCALAASLKLTFMVERIAPSATNRREWRWMSLAEARNRYRELIDNTRAAVMERKPINITS
jgi:hypothetical protein